MYRICATYSEDPGKLLEKLPPPLHPAITAALARRRRRSADPTERLEIRNQIVAGNLKFAAHLARKRNWRYPGTFCTKFQNAALGLIRAADSWDPDHESGASFVHYASFWIRQYIQRGARQSLPVRAPMHAAELRPSQFVFFTSLHPRRARAGDDSLFEKVPEELTTEQPDPATNWLSRAIGSLPPRQQTVVKRRFWRRHTLRQVADHLGISRERVRQIEAAALVKLRQHARRHGLRIRLQR